LSVNGGETDILRINSGVGIDETNVVVFRENICKFGRQLQDKK